MTTGWVVSSNSLTDLRRPEAAIAAQMHGLMRVLDDMPAVRFPFRLVTHRELRTSRRIRVVFDALAQGLAAAGPEGGDMATDPGG